MARLQRFFFIGIIVAIVALAIYGYFTDQLPFLRRPGGAVPSTPLATGVQGEGIRATTGQQFTFGAGTYSVTQVDRLSEAARGRPAPKGVFVVVQVAVRNLGRDPLTFGPGSFELFDRNGRRFTVDAEATKSSTTADRLDLAQTTIQPGLGGNGVLVFDVAPDATGLVLRLTQGYQDVVLNQ